MVVDDGCVEAVMDDVVRLEDILSSGFHFTWTKSRGNPQCKTLKKLDRILISEAFMDKFHAANGCFYHIRYKLQSIDTLAETSTLSSTDIESRSKIIKDLHDIEYHHLTDLRQKAKTRWALEGDENSGFFHGIINSNRNRSRINGLNIHGSWKTDLTALKSHIFQVYGSKFKEVISRPTFSSDNFKKLSSDDLLILDYPISYQENKDAV
ncbi:hypothetical protein Tco_0828048 [Tanacetum coccineum]